MLYNKDWDDKRSLSAIISWLETKDPQEKYDYLDHGCCLAAQYCRQVLNCSYPMEGEKSPFCVNNPTNESSFPYILEWIGWKSYTRDSETRRNYRTFGNALKVAKEIQLAMEQEHAV